MRPGITDDYYDILGLPQTASKDDINERFKRLILERHLDSGVGVAGATADFQWVGEKQVHPYQCLHTNIASSNPLATY